MIVAPEVADLFAGQRLTLIAGPCVIESYEMCRDLAISIRDLTRPRGLGFIFKASFDKANRTSLSSFRGPGLTQGLSVLKRLKEETGVAVLTDIHEPQQAAAVAQVADVLQIPAFLCRQTDLLVAAARTGRPTNIKKGQFLAPEDMRHAVRKFKDSQGELVSVTERGTCFGYHNLVVDMRSLTILKQATGAAVVFDATHAVQRPAAGEGVTTGDREFVPVLARAAAAVGIDGLFCEVHPRPEEALSDGPNSLTPTQLETVLDEVVAIDAARRQTR